MNHFSARKTRGPIYDIMELKPVELPRNPQDATAQVSHTMAVKISALMFSQIPVLFFDLLSDRVARVKLPVAQSTNGPRP